MHGGVFSHVSKSDLETLRQVATKDGSSGAALDSVTQPVSVSSAGSTTSRTAESSSSGVSIVAVADVYDALVSTRPYKRPWTVKDAHDYLHKHAGSQFDPICVEAFFERLDNINAIQKVFSDG